MRPVSRSAANEPAKAVRLMLAISTQHVAVLLVFICGKFLFSCQERSAKVKPATTKRSGDISVPILTKKLSPPWAVPLRYRSPVRAGRSGSAPQLSQNRTASNELVLLAFFFVLFALVVFAKD